jgi:hypothetical protein
LFKSSKTLRLWPPRADLKYWAFVSYTRQDRRQARWLHAGLERYRFPKDLIGSVTRKGLRVPERLYPCYLDVEELGAEPALTDPLMRALEASLTLAVVCSPTAASAPWVEREIAHFRHTTASETEVRTAHAWIVSGDVPRCFPPSFRAKEPAACDVGKQLFAFQREVVRLAAAVVGLDPAALWQRERARRRKRLAMTGLAATVVIATLAGLAVSAIRQNQRAESLRLASSSEAAGDPVDALRLGLGAVRRFATDQAERALSRALSIQRTRAILEHPTSVYVGEFSPDGTLFATGTEDGTVALWTVGTGQAHAAFKGHQGNVEDLAFSPSGRWLASVGTDATVRIWDAASLSPASTYSHVGTEINRVAWVSPRRRRSSRGRRTAWRKAGPADATCPIGATEPNRAPSCPHLRSMAC